MFKAFEMENEMLKIIEGYFSHPTLNLFYQTYTRLWNSNHQFPYFNYIGINFNAKEIVSVKFYFHVFNRISEKDANFFLPTTEDFRKYYGMYQESIEQNLEHSGCAFTLKFNPTKVDVIRGFQIRVQNSNKSNELIGQSKQLPFAIDDSCLPSGINYEYQQEKSLRKIYHYFNQDKHKIYFAERFKLPFLKSASLIEYSESNHFSKINTWYKNDPLLNAQANLLPPKQKLVVEQLCAKYQLTAKVFGYYENSDIKAVYLFITEPDKTRNKCSENKVYTDTIKSLICPTSE